MATFSPIKAVLSGLLFARARPAALLIWSAFLLVVMTVASLALFDLGGDSMTSLISAVQSDTPNLKQVAALMNDLQPASAFAALLMLVFGSVLVTAVLRVQLQPEPHPWGGLRLGGDELRVLGAMVAMLAVFMGAELLLVIGASLLASVSIAAAYVLVLAGFLAILGLMVRVSLAPVLAMTEKKISLPRAFALTQGRFWPLLGAYLTVAVTMILILMLVMMVFGALMAASAAATGGGLGQLFFALQHNYQEINPLLLVVYVLMNMAQVWVSVVFLAVAASVGVQAYRTFNAKP